MEKELFSPVRVKREMSPKRHTRMRCNLVLVKIFLEKAQFLYSFECKKERFYLLQGYYLQGYYWKSMAGFCFPKDTISPGRTNPKRKPAKAMSCGFWRRNEWRSVSGIPGFAVILCSNPVRVAEWVSPGIWATSSGWQKPGQSQHRV